MREAPYLDRGDDDLKMTQMKGAKCKMWRWAAGRKTGPNRAKNRLGRPAWLDRPRPFLPWFTVPFDLAPPRSINSSLLQRPLHTIILPTSIHQKVIAARWGRELDELVARINAGGWNETRGGLQAACLGVLPSFIAAIFIDDVLRSLYHPYVLQSL
jgi:hypothetical protein